MKLQFVMALVALATLAPLRAQSVPFPQGDFESSPATQWTSTTTGLGTAITFPTSGGNAFARISPVLFGSGKLTTDAGVPFFANSLYEVSLDMRSSSLIGAGLELGMEVRDGNNNIVAQLSNDQLLNLLGINLVNLPNLTTDLNLLDGALTDNLLLGGTVRDLLGSLLNGSGDLANPALLGSLQGLLHSLIGVDNSLLTRVTALLEDALAGSILSSGGGPLALTDLTELTGGTGLANIADILSLDLGETGDNAIATQLQGLLGFLLTTGNDGPVENLVALLTGLLGNPGDISLVDDLLTTLLTEQGLIGGVTNILNLSLIEDDLLGNLTSGELNSLLGLLDTGSSSMQRVKLLFTTGDTPPTGDLKVQLTAAATLALASAEFDNIAIRRFNLVPTPNPPGPGGPGAGNGGDTNIFGRPVVRPKLPRVIRHTTKPRITIKGTASAFGQGNSVKAVYSKLKGKGISSRDRKFKKAKGQSNWVARVRVPVSKRTRVIFVAEDAFGALSFEQFVRVSRK